MKHPSICSQLRSTAQFKKRVLTKRLIENSLLNRVHFQNFIRMSIKGYTPVIYFAEINSGPSNTTNNVSGLYQ